MLWDIFWFFKDCWIVAQWSRFPRYSLFFLASPFWAYNCSSLHWRGWTRRFLKSLPDLTFCGFKHPRQRTIMAAFAFSLYINLIKHWSQSLILQQFLMWCLKITVNILCKILDNPERLISTFKDFFHVEVLIKMGRVLV